MITKNIQKITKQLEYPLGRGINFEMDVKNIDKIYGRQKADNYNV